MSGACSLLVSVPKDEYSNGSHPVLEDGSTEAASEPVDGGPQPGSDDGGPRSGSDAGCDATFCDSFDDGPLGATWDKVQANAAELSLVPNALSPPSAFQMHLFEQVDAGTKRVGFLGKDFPFPTRAHCTFAVSFPKPISPSVDIELASFFAQNGNTYYRTYVKLLPGTGWALKEEITSQATTASTLPAPVATGVWHHVIFDAELGKSATLDVDGQKTSISLRAFPAGTLTFTLGESADSDLAEAVAVFDDVVCSLTP